MGKGKSMRTKTQQIDVTEKAEQVREFVVELVQIKEPVDVVMEGKVVIRALPAEEQADADFVEATPDERARAWREIQKIQRKVGRSLKEQGVTEDDVVREILTDD